MSRAISWSQLLYASFYLLRKGVCILTVQRDCSTEKASLALHSGQEVWGRDSNPAHTPKPRLSKAGCAHPGLNPERHQSRLPNRHTDLGARPCKLLGISEAQCLHLQTRITKGAPSLCGYRDEELRTQPRHKASTAFRGEQSGHLPSMPTPSSPEDLGPTAGPAQARDSQSQGATPRPWAQAGPSLTHTS